MDSSAAAWALVFATLILGAVAIFGEKVRSRFYKPRLNITTECAPPHCVALPMVNRENDERAASIYLRVLVKNEGEETARNVEVYAKGLTRRRADGVSWESVPEFPQM